MDTTIFEKKKTLWALKVREDLKCNGEIAGENMKGNQFIKSELIMITNKQKMLLITTVKVLIVQILILRTGCH